MYTIEHYHLGAKMLKVLQKYRQNMMVSAKDVRKEITQRRHFQAVGARKEESWRSSTPTSSSSLSGYVYYISFIDDISRKKWVYFLKNKDEVFSKFKEFKSFIKNHTEKKIKTFQSEMAENSHQMNSRNYVES